MPTFPTIQAQSLIQAPSQAPAETGGTQQAVNEVAGVVNTMGAEYTRQQHIAEAEARALAQKQEHDEAAVAVTNAASQEHMGSLQSAVDAANSGQMAGFTSNWAKGFDTRVAEGAKTIPQAGQGLYQIRMAELKSSLEPKFAEQENGARNRQLASDTGDGIETDANTAFIDPSQAAGLIARRRATIGGLLIPDAEKQQLWDKAGQSIASGAGVTLATNDPKGFLARVGVGSPDRAAAADALQRDPVLSQLKPIQLQSLTEHAQGLLARQDAAAQRAQDESERIGGQAYNKLVDFANSGAMPDSSYRAEVLNATNGTSYSAQAQQLLTMASHSAGFGAQTLPRQEAMLTDLTGQLQKGSNPDSQAMLTRLRTIHQQQGEAYKNDPWDAATRFAGVPAQPERPINAPEDGLQIIANRRGLMSTVETAAGGSVSPLRPAEASAWASSLANLSVGQRSELLGQAGSTLTGGQISALADQIATKDKPTALMLMTNDHTGSGRAVAERIGLGAQGLADKRVKADDTAQSGWRSEIAGYIRGTLGSTKAEDQAIDAAFYTRAAFELPEGTTPGYASPATSNIAAVEMVVGHPIDRGGVKTLLPRGMDESTFDSRLRAMTPDVLKTMAPDGQAYVNGQPMPLNLLHARLVDYGMRYYSPGVYAPVRNNAVVTTDKAGTKPLLLKVQ